MLNRLLTILFYYRTFALWSFFINIFFLIIQSSEIILVLITKLFIVCILYYLIIETKGKEKLTFYKNLGVSDFKLFASIYIIDALITIIFLSLINPFI